MGLLFISNVTAVWLLARNINGKSIGRLESSAFVLLICLLAPFSVSVTLFTASSRQFVLHLFKDSLSTHSLLFSM
jgi:hypothetical protein